jgi:glycosyltransferase involved in cell wall biosynthesis
MPEISVIIPVYNTEEYLHRCLDSVLSQTYTDFELIIVDDGSTDLSGEICDGYVVKDSRVRVFHQANQGQAAARNHALDWVFANSDSKYISFVDSDDWVHPRYLELLREGLIRFNVNICQCEHIETSGLSDITAVSENFSCIPAEEQYIHHYSAFMWDKLFSRSCWENMRFPEGQIYEDLAVWYKILFSEQELSLVDETLYYYYINPNGTMRQDWHPGMMARLDAWDQQVDFFAQKGDRTLFETALDHYCKIAIHEFFAVGRSSRLSQKEKDRYHAAISARVRKLLTRHKEILSRNTNYQLCKDIAFPALARWKSRLYRIIRR